MSDDRRKLVERYTGRPKTEAAEAGVPDDVEDNSYQPASPVSANRPPELMVEFRAKRGDSVALSYALLISAAFNPSQGIVLEFTTHRVMLTGRNLTTVHRALLEHRLAWVQELSGPLDDQPSAATVITSIKLVSPS